MKTITDFLEKYFKKLFISLLRIFFSPTRAASETPIEVMSILIVRQHDQLGDMLCSVPLLRALHDKYRNAEITLIASPVNYEIMRHHPYLDSILNYDKKRFFISPRVIFNFYNTLRKKRYDLAVVPGTVSVSVTSDLLAALSRARTRIGVKSLKKEENPTAFCFTIPVDLDWSTEPHRHQTLRNLDILKPSGIWTEDHQSVLGIMNDETKRAEKFLEPWREKFEYLIGFHPGAGKEENRWLDGRFSSIANRICREYDAAAVITAGPMDDVPFHSMRKKMQCPHVIVHNKPLREVAAIIDLLDLFVSNDTGIMHVAGATRTNLLSIFGPTDPLQWAPIGTKNRYLKSEDGKIESVSEKDVHDMVRLILDQLKK